MTANEGKSRGRVCLVGAGPGDEGLITVRGLELLRGADVVIYDVLANPRLLEEARPDAELICARRPGFSRAGSQERVNALMLEKASQGKRVVRLKGGDPYMFGRGGEEAAFLGGHGVDVEVVPGITAGMAAPMAAGVPLTQRGVSSTVTFATGHEDPAKPETHVDYQALAALIAKGGCACFYMGVANVHAIAASLQQHGLPGDTPVALVQWGFTPRQRSLRTTLGNAAKATRDAGLERPAIIVVGAVAALTDPGLDFYTRRPLFGQRIVITRTRHQASDLRRILAEAGGDVLEAPLIELASPSADEIAVIDEAIRAIKQYDWLILTSANGVTGLAERLRALALDARHFAGVRIATIGDATAAALATELGLRTDLLPANYVAEALADELLAREPVVGKRFLMLRADIARPTLRQTLEAAGATVADLPIYHSRRVAVLPDEVLDALRAGNVDWITFTSSSTATHLVELLGPQRNLLSKARLASIGPITTTTLQNLGLHVTAEAKPSNLAGLLDAMIRQPRP